ncbi:alpha/beta hydrolase, partial [Kocuria rosea]
RKRHNRNDTVSKIQGQGPSHGDRFLPLAFMRGVTRDRLHLEPDVMPGDHCPMLGHPTELATRLMAYHQSLGSSTPGARSSR